MMETKSLYDISWKVTEEEYRTDPALSYSTLAKFAREGFNNLETLFEKTESPSLTFGSAVDALITGGQEEFDKHFLVANFPETKDSVKKIVIALFNTYKEEYTSLNDIPDVTIIEQTVVDSFQLNWKPETRAKVIKEQGADYYSLLYLAEGKTLLDIATKEQVDNAVNALKTSPVTSVYFNNADDGMERLYQLKFKATFNGIDYRCMMDECVVDHTNKIIYPIDLKTSSHTEWDFYKSFVDWNYAIQARLYWRILRNNMDRDDYFKDFKLDDYRFVVVNKKTLTPLVWKFSATSFIGTLRYGKNKQIEFRDPCTLGHELTHYLNDRPAVPDGIEHVGDNNITDWLDSL